MIRVYKVVNVIIVAALAMALVVVAAPTPQTWVLRNAQLYTLRANCPNSPWQGRHLVTLPTSNRLGIENSTVHPETPPLKFFPVRLNDDRYALRGNSLGDDLSRTPYLAALTNNATRTASLKIVYLLTLLHESFDIQSNACPNSYECTADQWTLEEVDGGGIYRNLQLGAFKGKWEPFKDAGKEGWHVYWKGNPGFHQKTQFDLVPVTTSGAEN